MLVISSSSPYLARCVRLTSWAVLAIVLAIPIIRSLPAYIAPEGKYPPTGPPACLSGRQLAPGAATCQGMNQDTCGNAYVQLSGDSVMCYFENGQCQNGFRCIMASTTASNPVVNPPAVVSNTAPTSSMHERVKQGLLFTNISAFYL